MPVASAETVQVLLVEDSPDLADIAVTRLEREDTDLSVETATSASEALDRIGSSVPDCIVSDYDIPGMDGIEFLERVRETNPDVPFLLYTGDGSEAVASDAISAGVTDYLRKQSDTEQYKLLTSRIRHSVRARHEAERAARQEELMRLTELAGDAGGFEIEYETGELLLTDGARRLTGLSGGDHSLTDVLLLHPPDERPQVRAAIDRAAETGAETHGQWRIEPDNGEGRLLSTTIVPVGGAGDTTTLRGTISDITEQRRRERELRTAKQQYQSIAESFPDGAVCLFDRDLRFVRARGKELQAVGLSPETLEGSTPHEVFPAEIADEHVRYFREALAGNSQEYEQAYEGRRYRIRAVPVEPENEDSDTEHGMAVAENITEQARRRQQLERQNERLEEFASIVSHDLRNPLQVARTRLKLAGERVDSPHIADAIDAIDRSEALIDDLLTLARQGEQATETEPIGIAALVRQAWQTVETAEATVEIETDRTVQADWGRLRQLFENLFANAVEHAGPAVTVTVEDIEGGVAVEDNGPGIPETDRETVFEAGYTTSTHGTGFGLRIVEQVATNHGWQVSLTDGTEGGARFEFTGVDIVA